MPSDLDLITGGFGAIAQGAQPYAQRQLAEQDRNMPLSPYEQQLGGDLHARMQRAQELVQNGADPREMAVRVKAGLPLENVPTPPPLSVPSTPGPSNSPSYNYAPGMQGPQRPGPQMDAAPESYPSHSPSMGMMSAPVQRPLQSQGPQTRGDMAALMSASPFLAGTKDTADDKMNRLLVTLASREGEGTKNRATRTGIAQDNRESTESIAAERIKLGYAGLRNRLEGIQMQLRGAEHRLGMRAGTDRELAALKMRHAKILSDERIAGSIINGIGNIADNPRALAQLKEIQDQLDIDVPMLERDIMLMQSQGTTRGGEQSGQPPAQDYTVNPGQQGQPAPVPQGLPAAMSPGTPAIPTNTVIREPSLSVSGGGGSTPQGPGSAPQLVLPNAMRQLSQGQSSPPPRSTEGVVQVMRLSDRKIIPMTRQQAARFLADSKRFQEVK